MEPAVESRPPLLDQTVEAEKLGAAMQVLCNSLRTECIAAAARHQDIVSRMFQQQQDFSRLISEVRCELSVHNATWPKLPKPAPFAPEAPLAPDAPEAPEIEFLPNSSTIEANHVVKEPVETATPEDPITPPSSPRTKEPQTPLSISESQSQFQSSASGLKRDSELSHMLHKKGSFLGSENVWKARNWVALRALLESVVTHSRFEASIAALIMANAVVLCFEVQYHGLQVGYDLKFSGCDASASAIWPAGETFFHMSDWVFGVLFLLEAATKVACFNCRYFFDAWNWLDFSSVAAFFLEKFAAQVIPFDAKAMRLLRFLRLLRLVRVLRTLESLDQLYIMTTAIKGMYMVLLWACVLLAIILMTESLFLTQILHAYYFKDLFAIELSAAELASRHKFYEYFGSFTRCFLSMFELTLANWPPVTRLLSEEASEYFMPLCLIHKLTVGFAIVGVITGVILQETFKVAATDDWVMLRQKKRAIETAKAKMRALFEALDKNVDGQLDYEEFSVIADITEVQTWLASMDVETDDLRTLFTLIDYDGDGFITLDELVSRMPRIKGTARSIDLLKFVSDAEARVRMFAPAPVHQSTPACNEKQEQRHDASASKMALQRVVSGTF